MNNRNENVKIFKELTVNELSEIIRKCLMSDSFDPRGEQTGYPLFERYEDRRRSGTNVEGIIPLLMKLMNEKLPTTIRAVREHQYPLSRNRCDLVLTHSSGNELWMELKLHWEKPCTPYETDFTVDEYLRDIEKFNEISDDIQKSIVQIAFCNKDTIDTKVVRKIDTLLGDASFACNSFPMPTQRGRCYCLVMLWVF